MIEAGLINQVLRIINASYSNIYIIDVIADDVYNLAFDNGNNLILKEKMNYSTLIESLTRLIHPEDQKSFFDALSVNKLEESANSGQTETKIKYRRISETGDYRFFLNIIDYLTYEGRKLIFMMSEDISDRLVDIEEENRDLLNKVTDYQKRLTSESESITDAIYEINNILESSSQSGDLKPRDTRGYINAIMNRVASEHPDLNASLGLKLKSTNNYQNPAILIVDDSSIIRNSLKRIFQDNFTIIMAKNGQEAIDTLNSKLPNNTFIAGILLDLIMPVKDGFQVLDYLKDNNLLVKIPVAIISGDETRETRKRVYQYDIVDMLEKPFNTENIRRRISKIISLYLSSNNLLSIVNLQSQELEKKGRDDMTMLDNILHEIVANILKNAESVKLKKMAQVLTLYLYNNYPELNLDLKYIDYIVDYLPLYNIGSIAMDENVVFTSQSIRQEINYGLAILKNYLKENNLVAENIIKYSCEMYDGSGYPDNLKGSSIPLEAQIANILIHLREYTKTKSFVTAFKLITDKEKNKYNPKLLAALKDSKKDLKNILS